MASKFQLPRGTYDILPDSAPLWQYLSRVLKEEAEILGFQRIDVPSFEDENLYERSLGDVSDVVLKEMFGVTRASSKAEVEKEDKAVNLVLRPEFTASIVRSYLEKGMQSWPQPVKLYTDGSVFRYSRPQKGRYREFRQLNWEIIGDGSPQADILDILLTWNIFQRLGLAGDVVIDINSLGDAKCRPKIRKALLDYLSQNLNKLAPIDVERVKRNPLRVLDSKEPKTIAVVKAGPQLVDLLCEECKKHFAQVLEVLDELNIPYNIDPYLVRGLDYYTRTTFEVRRVDDETRQNSMGGGGRYDELVELLGGRPTPGVGTALGSDRIIEYMKEKGIRVPEQKIADVFVAALGEHSLKVALTLLQKIRQRGIKAGISLTRNGLKEQLATAERIGARFTLILGEREVRDNSIIIKDVNDGTQETVALGDVVERIEKKLAK